MIKLDVSRMEKKAEAHAYLKEMLGFPAYYGNNLDALHDCLTELRDTRVCFVGSPEEDGYAESILRVFRDAAEENPRLKLFYE